jgi:bzd-type benzoyl-CoA reductase Q subunit
MAEEKEYWRWLESRWTNPDIALDGKEGKIITAGCDVGSVSSQAVIMVDGELYAYSNMRTGSDSPDSAMRAMKWALEDTGLAIDDIRYSIGTGYGRVNVPFAQRTITEISCHARGANFMYGPTVKTVLDMGGQDCKAIHCDERGKVLTFLMNDKCAAGTGRGMEVFADLMGVSINEIGELSFEIDEEPPPVTSTCVIFAKSEATGMLKKGVPKSKVIAAYCSAMAHRIYTLLERIGVEKDFAITGGIAKNVGVTRRLFAELGLESLTSKYDTQIAGAIGAALFAKALVEREAKK